MVFEATVGLSRQVVTLVLRSELVGSIPIDHPNLYRDGSTVRMAGLEPAGEGGTSRNCGGISCSR